jgi:hypothetical protein
LKIVGLCDQASQRIRKVSVLRLYQPDELSAAAKALFC